MGQSARQPRALRGAMILVAAMMALPARSAPPAVVNRPSNRSALTTAQKQAETNAAKLMMHAQRARQTGDLNEALHNYDLVVELFEEAYGPEHERLVEPLHAIVETAREQYALELAWRHRFNRGLLNPATKAQQRIVEIYRDRDDLDPNVRVNALVDLGDCYLYVMDGKKGLASYAEAWQLQARLKTAESADAMFEDTSLVGFFTPVNPQGHGDWKISITYSVGPDTRVSVQDVQGNASGAVKGAMRKAFERTHARPRFVGGTPVASENLSIAYDYDGDGRISLAH